MRTLIIIEIEDALYGIWEDEVKRAADVGSVSTIPMAPDYFAGVADVEHHTAYLLDLSASLGHGKTGHATHGRVLVLAEGEKETEGFLYEKEFGRAEISEEDVLRMPGCLEFEAITGFARHEGRLVAIVDVRRLYYAAELKGEAPAVRARLPENYVPYPPVEAERLGIFTVGEEKFAVVDRGTEVLDAPLDEIFPLPLAPGFIEGVTVLDGRTAVVVDIATRIGGEGKKGPLGRTLVHRLDEDSIVCIKLEGEFGWMNKEEYSITPLPPLAGTVFMSHAARTGDDVAPVLDLPLLLKEDETLSLEGLYEGREGLPAMAKEALEVREFMLLDDMFSVPEDEVEDVVDLGQVRRMPGLHPLMLGIAVHNGEALPVLDLALSFGIRSRPGPGWKMLLVNNGSFRAFVIAREVLGTRILRPEEQIALPIKQPHGYVYGCYLEEGRIRLVLNPRSIVVHFDEEKVSRMLGELRKEKEAMLEKPPAEEEIEKAEEEAEARERAEAEAGEKAEAEARERAEAEAREKAEAEAEAGERTEAEAGEKAEAEAEARERTEAEAEAGEKAEAEARERAEEEAEARERTEEEAEARERTEAEAEARERTEEEAGERTEAEARERTEAEARERTEAEAEAASGRNRAARPRRRKSKTHLIVLAGLVLAIIVGAVVYFIYSDEGKHETVAGRDAKARETAEGIADVPIALPMAGDEKGPERTSRPPETSVPETSLKEREAETEMPVRVAEEASSGRKLPEERTYTVGRGDTLWHIAERFKGDPFLYHEVARDNEIRNPDLIYPGQKVKISRRIPSE